ncbi:hypothetical protein B0H10DRAFT_881141 [Mycena sp. CBHHK59/15]|nr:hypothetical protein B0H10DRAFT_881141 [Mycena sp. CBHHK59/15]
MWGWAAPGSAPAVEEEEEEEEPSGAPHAMEEESGDSDPGANSARDGQDMDESPVSEDAKEKDNSGDETDTEEISAPVDVSPPEMDVDAPPKSPPASLALPNLPPHQRLRPTVRSPRQHQQALLPLPRHYSTYSLSRPPARRPRVARSPRGT